MLLATIFITLFQLRQAVVDHISDAFVNSINPMAVVFEATGTGDSDLMEMKAHNFKSHAENMEKVSKIYTPKLDNNINYLHDKKVGLLPVVVVSENDFTKCCFAH